MSQEARFLEAREARAAAQRSSRRNHKNTNNLHEFWTSLRQDLSKWESRLESLHSNNNHMTASQRIECTESLDALLNDLYALRRRCLSSTDAPDLPPADIRLLHQEFTARSTRLDQVREELVPTTKFTFKRYRAAMKQQQQQQQESMPAIDETVSSNTVTTATTTTTTTTTTTALAGNAIQNYHDAMLVLDSRNGTLTIQPQNGQAPIVVHQETKDVSSSSLLVQNLEQCQVTINGNYKALHIQNVSNSIIRVVNAVDGAIHVTACHEMELFATCHQLRMHESLSLKCHVHDVGSGPIMEDCNEIVFYACSPQDLVYDTKDFNWLRNGVPSPNFCIIVEEQQEQEKVHSGTRSSEGNEEQVILRAVEAGDRNGCCLVNKEHSPNEHAILDDQNISSVSIEVQSDEDDEL